MATAPLRTCPVPGCPERVVRGRCPKHARDTMRLADERRGSRHARGYTDEWAAYSRQFLLDHPICMDPFGVHGWIGKLSEVTDHIIPPKYGGAFWDPTNHQALCGSCNLRKAAEDRRRFEGRGRGGVQSLKNPSSVPACDLDTQNAKMNQVR